MNERPNKSLTDEIASREPGRQAFEPDTRMTPGNAATQTSGAFRNDPQSPANDPRNGHDGQTRYDAADRGAATMHTTEGAGSTGQAAMPASMGTSSPATSDSHATLLSEDKAESFSRRWSDIQSTFVDEPQSAVRGADGLVSEVIQELSHGFARERQGLEQQWSGGGDVSTEDLRMALRHYRDFFQRLLAA